MAKKQYFDIKYPFTDNGIEKYELDLNENELDRVKSNILHVIFTPKGSRLRNPEFGTDLVRFIFESNDEDGVWSAIQADIKETVKRWVPGVDINNVSVVSDEDSEDIFVKVIYSVKDGYSTYNNSVVVKM